MQGKRKETETMRTEEIRVGVPIGSYHGSERMGGLWCFKIGEQWGERKYGVEKGERSKGETERAQSGKDKEQRKP